MFLTPEQTGGPRIFALRRHNQYLAVEVPAVPDKEVLIMRAREFDIEELAVALGKSRGAGSTWQEHEKLILLACRDEGLFGWLNKTGGTTWLVQCGD